MTREFKGRISIRTSYEFGEGQAKSTVLKNCKEKNLPILDIYTSVATLYVEFRVVASDEIEAWNLLREYAEQAAGSHLGNFWIEKTD